ncbi:hypothetical protein NIES23_42350 [Trichormus variabilis NIES-23]|uniref:Uncharacterized protein n=1 Tax=Trichormus variabilis NIES-23 TaxID=1973479 RepID=A0A1Z4KR40_ANAVA|nr:hypothetical protein NIES23_42350 [Trichormus variabilis NIES-23]
MDANEVLQRYAVGEKILGRQTSEKSASSNQILLE